MSVDYDVVVPTAGRPSLRVLLAALAEQREPLPRSVVVVDDRQARGRAGSLDLGPAAAQLRDRLRVAAAERAAGRPATAERSPAGRVAAAGLVVVRGGGRGPAAARNRGWRAGAAPWVAFLDDDVLPGPDWSARLALDLGALAPGVAASQGRIHVPLPRDRRPNDRERCVAGLAGAVWATADMAYRRRALEALGGFDERFRRAYREDSDLGLRAVRAGWRIERGARACAHPVAPAGPLASVATQAGNADDVLMRALHGRGWRAAAGAPAGRRARHLATVAAAAGALGAAQLAARRPPAARRPLRTVAVLCAAGYAAGTAELAWARIAPGPRDVREVAAMLATSVLIPLAAALHTARGLLRAGSAPERPDAGEVVA